MSAGEIDLQISNITMLTAYNNVNNESESNFRSWLTYTLFPKYNFYHYLMPFCRSLLNFHIILSKFSNLLLSNYYFHYIHLPVPPMRTYFSYFDILFLFFSNICLFTFTKSCNSSVSCWAKFLLLLPTVSFWFSLLLLNECYFWDNKLPVFEYLQNPSRKLNW